MRSPLYEPSRTNILTTNDEIERRVQLLVGRAQSRQIWLMFLDASGVQSPLLVPFGDVPVLPRAEDLPGWAQIIAGATDATQAHSVIAVVERYASVELTAADRAWARYIASGCHEAAVDLRAVLLSHRRGIATIPPSEYA